MLARAMMCSITLMMLNQKASCIRLLSSSASVVRRSILFYNDVYEVVLPPKHRFPMPKYRMVRESLQHEFENDNCVEFLVSPRASLEELKSTHCPKYVDRYVSGQMTAQEIRKTGFPWTIANVERSTSSTGGTIAAMRAVMSGRSSSIACHIAGGTHHAFYDYGEGFCVFSDIAVASNIALREFPDQVKQILIIDLDVHQGNGNAVLFKDESRVFTFSMHCKDNYFSKKETSDIDVELPPNTSDEEYLSTLNAWLSKLFDMVKPQLVFFQAGVDIFEGDRLGKLSISREGLWRRNAAVFKEIIARDLKCVVTMGGGYPRELDPSSQRFEDIVQCHADVYRGSIAYNLNRIKN